MSTTLKNNLPLITATGLFVFYAAIAIHPASLLLGDLGRHLKNGEITLTTGNIPQTNLYSYTNPEFPFVNHHWLTGVVFYTIQTLFGFPGLSLFGGLVSLVTFFVFFRLSWKLGGPIPAIAASTIFFPLLIYRLDFRPELFTYLFAGIFITMLIRKKQLFLLPILEVLWVNLHIYFFLGPFIIATFFLEEIVTHRRTSKLGVILILTMLATLINPNGITGTLYPFMIFRNYAYAVVEDQTFFFIASRYPFSPGVFFVVALSIFAASWAIRFARRDVSFAFFLLSLATSIAATAAVRNFTLLALFATAITSANVKLLNKKFLAIVVLLIVALYLTIEKEYFFSRPFFQIGIDPSEERAVMFIKEKNIRGPIFNNYDIGGYLIYYLYPEKRVFIDNRPEAYPSSFLTQEYVAAQEGAWERVDAKYHFNAIIWHRNELSQRSLDFQKKMLQDPDWAPVYADKNILILVKKPEKKI